MEYKIEIISSAHRPEGHGLASDSQSQKDLDNLEKRYFDQIKDRINSLKSNPRPPNCLKLTAEEGYRIRSGDFRILYRIDDKNKIIYIYRIKHRKESYR